MLFATLRRWVKIIMEFRHNLHKQACVLIEGGPLGMHVFSYPCISSFLSGDPDLDMMTLTNKFDLDVLKLDQLGRV